MTVIENAPRILLAVQQLVDCVCETIAERGQGPTCWCGLWTGQTVSWEDCSECSDGQCGMAYVRQSASYPSSEFPNQDFNARCAVPLAYQYEVGIVRCWPTMEEDGSPPDAAITTEASFNFMLDQHALRYAIQCCPTDHLGPDGIRLGLWTPLGPSGGCVAGFWQVWLDAS